MLQSPAEQLLPLCHRDRKAYYAAPRVQNLLCYRFNPFLRRLQHVRADAPGPPCERNLHDSYSFVTSRTGGLLLEPV